MRVYISGAITEKTDYMERFAAAEEEINSCGDVAVNPAKINASMPVGTTHSMYMEVSYALMRTCDCMYVLKDWRNSAGVNLEIEYARKLGMTIFYEENRENNKTLPNEKELIREQLAELEAYRASGVKAEDLKTIDETYREMAVKLYLAEREIERLNQIIERLSPKNP